MSRTIYIYPDRFYRNDGRDNPYLSDLRKAFESSGMRVIKSRTGALGPIDIFLYLRKCDLISANWLEETINTKFGYLKVCSLFVLLPLLKLWKVKLVWTIHNKESHAKKNLKIISFTRKLLFKYSDVVLAHANHGLEIFKEDRKKIIYYPHPFKVRDRNGALHEKNDFKYDVFIWGRIEPYKGILEFLQYLKSSQQISKFNVYIYGKCSDLSYWKSLAEFKSDKVHIVNGYLEDAQMADLMRDSRLVLFTHIDSSVLSSGALIDSLGYGKLVLGPDVGNFKDLSEEGLCKVYSNFEQLVKLLDFYKTNGIVDVSPSKIYRFAENHTWQAFATFIIKKVLPT